MIFALYHAKDNFTEISIRRDRFLYLQFFTKFDRNFSSDHLSGAETFV